MDKLMHEKLITKAIEAREKSYSPYSNFRVGAALLAKSGEIFCGCNVEIAGHSATCCAERTAFFKAVSSGITDFCAIAVVGGPLEGLVDDCFPCGICRQVMSEFCGGDFVIITAQNTQKYLRFTLEELLPHRFEKH